MTIGFVVIGKNEGARLVACLASVKEYECPIVYVDSGSTDGSVENAQMLNATVVELDQHLPFTAARARNVGLASLMELSPTTSLVQFLDGDCTMAEGWLAKAKSFLEERTDCAVVCGRRRELHPYASIFNWLCDIEWNTALGEAKACGGDALMRVDAFRDVEGYRDGLVAGEEPELCIRLRSRGWKIWRLNEDMSLHDARMTRFAQWWRRTMRGGYAFAEVSDLHRNSNHGIWTRETRRAAVWAGLLPLSLLGGLLINRALFAGILIYPLQLVKIAVRSSQTGRPWTYALFMLLAKFAEFAGIALYYWRKVFGGAAPAFSYKTPA